MLVTVIYLLLAAFAGLSLTFPFVAVTAILDIAFIVAVTVSDVRGPDETSEDLTEWDDE